jgi:hypothetical protein
MSSVFNFVRWILSVISALPSPLSTPLYLVIVYRSNNISVVAQDPRRNGGWMCGPCLLMLKNVHLGRFTSRRVPASLCSLWLKADSHIAYRAHAVPLSCRAALIHTCHAAPLPCSDSALSFVKVRVVGGNIRTASSTDRLFCSFTLTTCIWDWYASDSNLCGTPHSNRKKPKRTGSPQAVSRRRCCALALTITTWSEHGMGMAWQVWNRYGCTV